MGIKVVWAYVELIEEVPRNIDSEPSDEWRDPSPERDPGF